MFSVLDMNRNIEIKGVHSLHGELILRISPDRPDVIELPFDGSGEISAKEHVQPAGASAFIQSRARGLNSMAEYVSRDRAFRSISPM